MICPRRETTIPFQSIRSSGNGVVAVVPDDGTSGVDLVGVDGNLAVVFELIHGHLGGVVVAEEKPEEYRGDDGRDADTG